MRSLKVSFLLAAALLTYVGCRTASNNDKANSKPKTESNSTYATVASDIISSSKEYSAQLTENNCAIPESQEQANTAVRTLAEDDPDLLAEDLENPDMGKFLEGEKEDGTVEENTGSEKNTAAGENTDTKKEEGNKQDAVALGVGTALLVTGVVGGVSSLGAYLKTKADYKAAWQEAADSTEAAGQEASKAIKKHNASRTMVKEIENRVEALEKKAKELGSIPELEKKAKLGDAPTAEKIVAQEKLVADLDSQVRTLTNQHAMAVTRSKEGKNANRKKASALAGRHANALRDAEPRLTEARKSLDSLRAKAGLSAEAAAAKSKLTERIVLERNLTFYKEALSAAERASDEKWKVTEERTQKIRDIAAIRIEIEAKTREFEAKWKKARAPIALAFGSLIVAGIVTTAVTTTLTDAEDKCQAAADAYQAKMNRHADEVIALHKKNSDI